MYFYYTGTLIANGLVFGGKVAVILIPGEGQPSAIAAGLTNHIWTIREIVRLAK
jgi:hypothetical protein